MPATAVTIAPCTRPAAAPTTSLGLPPGLALAVANGDHTPRIACLTPAPPACQQRTHIAHPPCCCTHLFFSRGALPCLQLAALQGQHGALSTTRCFIAPGTDTSTEQVGSVLCRGAAALQHAFWNTPAAMTSVAAAMQQAAGAPCAPPAAGPNKVQLVRQWTMGNTELAAAFHTATSSCAPLPVQHSCAASHISCCRCASHALVSALHDDVRLFSVLL